MVNLSLSEAQDQFPRRRQPPGNAAATTPTTPAPPPPQQQPHQPGMMAGMPHGHLPSRPALPQHPQQPAPPPPPEAPPSARTDRYGGGARGRTEADSKNVIGMAAAAYLAGRVVLGPLLAIGAALGGAYVASGLAGEGRNVDAARNIGAATADVGTAVYSKARDLDGRYQIVDKTKRAARQAYSSAVQLNSEHRITERVASGVSRTAAGLSRAVQTAQGSRRRGSGGGAHGGAESDGEAASQSIPDAGRGLQGNAAAH